jgi:L-asparaginase II
MTTAVDPILIELTRGALVESVHRGALAICRPNGEVAVSIGDVHRPVFPRSAIKCFQALPLIDSGAADRFGFADAEIALACASHSATPRHVHLAGSMLARAGRDASVLACGAHDPVHEPSAHALRMAGLTPTRLHNNCSGKHAGMIATCVHCGYDPASYVDLSHPLQRRIAEVLHDFTSATIAPELAGTDGCSAPNWAIPLLGLATGYARFATGDGLTPARRAACERIMGACAAEPGLVAGPGRLDTVAMTALGRRLFMKTGAEAVYCGAIPAMGIGFAIKIDDGTKRASETVVQAMLDRVFPGQVAYPALGRLTNYAGLDVGETRCGEALRPVLDAVVRLQR